MRRVSCVVCPKAGKTGASGRSRNSKHQCNRRNPLGALLPKTAPELVSGNNRLVLLCTYSRPRFKDAHVFFSERL